MPESPLRTVLVATDLGETGEEVLRSATVLAGAAGADLHVVHAFDFAPDPYPDLYAVTTEGFQWRIRAAERELDEQVRRAVPEGVRVAGRKVVIDLAHRAILEFARGIPADVIVLGPHRRRGFGDAFLGSTADRVVRSADVPCLVVRRPLRLPLRRVVVPQDLSAPSRGALEVALQWCETLGEVDPGGELRVPELEVDVVHVVPRAFAGQDFPFSEALVGPELHRDVEAVLGAAEDRAELEVREVVLWADDVAEGIVRAARERDAGLLVLATHGRGAVQRALLGSVASSVARQAECPVLLVPPSLWSFDEAASPATRAAPAG